MMGLMYEMFVIGPGTFRGGGEETVEQIAQIRADVGYQFILFIQMMSSVGSIVRIYEGYKRFTGNAARYVEFRAKMAAICKMESETAGQQLLSGDSIKFTNCMIYTPAKDKDGNLSNKLVHDLTFEVGKQEYVTHRLVIQQHQRSGTLCPTISTVPCIGHRSGSSQAAHHRSK